MPVNFLSRGPAGNAVRFSDAVSYSAAEIAQDKLLATPPTGTSGKAQLPESQLAHEKSPLFRATQLLAVDARSSAEVLVNPGFVLTSNLG
jgi:hypothetical protein